MEVLIIFKQTYQYKDRDSDKMTDVFIAAGTSILG